MFSLYTVLTDLFHVRISYINADSCNSKGIEYRMAHLHAFGFQQKPHKGVTYQVRSVKYLVRRYFIVDVPTLVMQCDGR